MSLDSGVKPAEIDSYRRSTRANPGLNVRSSDAVFFELFERDFQSAPSAADGGGSNLLVSHVRGVSGEGRAHGDLDVADGDGDADRRVGGDDGDPVFSIVSHDL